MHTCEHTCGTRAHIHILHRCDVIPASQQSTGAPQYTHRDSTYIRYPSTTATCCNPHQHAPPAHNTMTNELTGSDPHRKPAGIYTEQSSTGSTKRPTSRQASSSDMADADADVCGSMPYALAYADVCGSMASAYAHAHIRRRLWQHARPAAGQRRWRRPFLAVSACQCLSQSAANSNGGGIWLLAMCAVFNRHVLAAAAVGGAWRLGSRC